MALVEGLRLVVAVAVLSSHLIRVQVLLSLPCCTIKEVHGSIESTSSDTSLASLGRFHGVVMIDTALVGDFLAEVIARLEAGVREGLSCSCCQLVCVHARMGNRERGFAIPIVDCVHCRICLRNP